MTTPTPDHLTALSALSLAFDIVRTPCSAAETQRAEVLLGIAREIREEQQYRSLRNMRADLARLRIGAPVQPADPPQAVPAADSTTLRGYLGRFAQGRQTEGGPVEPATAYMPAFAEQTQQFPIVWSVGDKADCRHCHTPIILVNMIDEDGDPRTEVIWRHKYTGQTACAVAAMSGGEGGEPTHTFAEPAPR